MIYKYFILACSYEANVVKYAVLLWWKYFIYPLPGMQNKKVMRHKSILFGGGRWFEIFMCQVTDIYTPVWKSKCKWVYIIIRTSINPSGRFRNPVFLAALFQK